MRHYLDISLVTLIAATCAAPSLVAEQIAAPPQPSAALEEYVAKHDTTYQWKKRREGKLGQGQYVELILTSQTWRHTAWKHQLFVYRPATVNVDSQALLLIAGGTWNESLEKPPAAADGDLPNEARLVAAIADTIQAPVAVLLQVPQQPLFGGMVEDEIISHTFVNFIKTNDSEWPLLLPMVKSAVRGMDAVQEFAKLEWGLKVQNFLVTGASKRGWTTWLTAAVDARVNALAPMVIDMLNMREHMELQKLSFGGFSEQIRDYTEKGLQDRLDTDGGEALRSIVDPYSYRGQLKQPKLIILGTNDRYWPVDALNLYWDQLSGEKYILYVPNNGHGLRDYPRVLGTVAALHQHISGGNPLPKLNWRFDDRGGTLRLLTSCDTKPAAVTGWFATSGTRDFRDARWTSQPAKLDDENEGGYVVDLKKPPQGFAAVFAEAQFNGRAMPFYLSTNLRVVPQAETGSSAGGD